MNKQPHQARRIGIWIDHSKAMMFEPHNGDDQIETIHSGQESQERFKGEGGDGTRLGNYRSTDNEYHKNRKEENTTKAYFKDLAQRLEAFDEIYLCGPGQARKEFQNMLGDDKHFHSKQISNDPCDQLSENQLRAHVRKHFEESLIKG